MKGLRNRANTKDAKKWAKLKAIQKRITTWVIENCPARPIIVFRSLSLSFANLRTELAVHKY